MQKLAILGFLLLVFLTCGALPPTQARAETHAEHESKVGGTRQGQTSIEQHAVEAVEPAAPAGHAMKADTLVERNSVVEVERKPRQADAEGQHQQPNSCGIKCWGPLEWSAVASAFFSLVLALLSGFLWVETRRTRGIS